MSCLSMWVWAKLHVHLSQLTSAWSTEASRSCCIPPQFFGVFSLHIVLTNAAQQCMKGNTCLSLTKNFLSCSLLHACFSETSFYLCLLHQNIPSRVYLSLLPVSALVKHPFTCVCFRKTLFYMPPHQQHHNTTDLPKNPQVFTSVNTKSDAQGPELCSACARAHTLRSPAGHW